MFSDNDRLIFRYSDGTREIAADPLALRRKLLQASAGEFWELLARSSESEAPPPGQDGVALVMAAQDAQEKLLLCIRQAFGLPVLDPDTGLGCTEAMCWAVLDAYLDMQEKNVSPGGNSAISSPPTASLPASS